MKAARPLYQHIARTLVWALAIQWVLALVLLVAFVLWPLADRAAQDKAAFIVLAAQTWLELPPDTRSDFEQELQKNHGLSLSKTEGAPAPVALSPLSPYPYLLERALRARLDIPPRVISCTDRHTIEVYLWVHDQFFRVVFASPRLVQGRVIILVGALLISSLLAALLALWMSQRLLRPLRAITQVAALWERGEEARMPSRACMIKEVCALASQLEAMMRQLRLQDRERTTLLAGISHDLRTPLARLRLALEMLSEDTDHELRQAMVSDVEAMDQLIGQALQLARARKAPLEPVDLNHLAEGLVAEYGRLGIPLDYQPIPPCIRPCAPQVLRRILGNLIDNAWRYGGEQTVELRLECNHERVRFAILDRGPGIPEEQREAVFEPFVRLEPSRNPDTGGMGLGLAIAHQLARVQGWRLGLAPREGGGTRAWLEMDLSTSARG